MVFDHLLGCVLDKKRRVYAVRRHNGNLCTQKQHMVSAMEEWEWVGKQLSYVARGHRQGSEGRWGGGGGAGWRVKDGRDENLGMCHSVCEANGREYLGTETICIAWLA